MRVVIDRFEGDYAICEKEDRTMIDIKKSELPSDCKEGDILFIEENVIRVDKVATEKRRKEIEDLTKNLWK